MKFFLLLSFVCFRAWAIDTLATGFTIPSSGTKRIYQTNGVGVAACYDVQNTDVSKSIFVPTKTATEWDTFINNKPAYVTLTSCAPASCYEIKTVLSGSADGTYTIDSDGIGGNASYSVYCDMTTDGGGWTRVFSHSIAGGYFADSTEANETNIGTPTALKYSILSRLANFYRSGKLELKMNWPADNATRNWWTQTSNPTTSPIAGYVAVAIDTTAQGWGGLELNTLASSSSYIDGTVGTGNWFYAIASYAAWVGGTPAGIPGSLGAVGMSRVDLWVK